MRKKDTFCGFYSDFLFCLTSLWLNWYLCSFFFGFSLVWLSRDKEFLFCLCIVCLSRKQGSEEMKRFSFFIWIIFLPSFARLCLAVEKTETIKKKSSIFVCFGWYLCVFFFPFWFSFSCLQGKQRAKKEKTFTTTTTSLKSQSNGFCSYDNPEHKTSLVIYTIKRLETFFFFGWYLCVFPPFG